MFHAVFIDPRQPTRCVIEQFPAITTQDRLVAVLRTRSIVARNNRVAITDDGKVGNGIPDGNEGFKVGTVRRIRKKDRRTRPRGNEEHAAALLRDAVFFSLQYAHFNPIAEGFNFRENLTDDRATSN